MKMVKNIAIVAFAASFMFAGVGFHMSNIYTNMDSGTNVGSSWGATFDLNESTGIGYDSILGMLIYFDAPAGVSLRLGWSAGAGSLDGADAANLAPQTSVGLGFTWWNGGTGLKTSISTNYDYMMAPDATVPAVQAINGSNLSVVVGFGF